jgi:hypothetical protein
MTIIIMTSFSHNTHGAGSSGGGGGGGACVSCRILSQSSDVHASNSSCRVTPHRVAIC